MVDRLHGGEIDRRRQVRVGLQGRDDGVDQRLEFERLGQAGLVPHQVESSVQRDAVDAVFDGQSAIG